MCRSKLWENEGKQNRHIDKSMQSSTIWCSQFSLFSTVRLLLLSFSRMSARQVQWNIRKYINICSGGPVPKDTVKTMHASWQPLGFVSNWGGMEVGNGMMYPVSVVDGMVHQLGGWRLQLECAQKPIICNDEKCPIGHAIKTSNGNKELTSEYESIIHTTPPFYLHDDNPTEELEKCYKNSIDLAFSSSTNASKEVRVACPILGAGARGFPMDIAMQVAAKMSVKWIKRDFITSNEFSPTEHTIAFGLLEPKDANEFKIVLEQMMSNDALIE